MRWHRFFKHPAEDNHGGDPDFDNNFFVNEHRPFFENGVYNHFIISFGFVFLVQGFVLLLWVVIALIYRMKRAAVQPENFNALSEEDKRAAQNSYMFWSKVNNHFSFKIVMTVFLMFIIETLVFAVYNFQHDEWDFDHWLFVLSLIFAIVWFVIVILLWIWDLIVAARAEEVLLE